MTQADFFETIQWLSNKYNDYQINKYLVLVSVSITNSVILLNKAHYWVLKQHTDSAPQPLQPKEPHRWTVILFSSLPRSRGNPINYTSVSFAMQIRFPWFTPQSFFPKILHNHPQATKNSFKQETETLYNWKPVKTASD